MIGTRRTCVPTMAGVAPNDVQSIAAKFTPREMAFRPSLKVLPGLAVYCRHQMLRRNTHSSDQWRLVAAKVSVPDLP